MTGPKLPAGPCTTSSATLHTSTAGLTRVAHPTVSRAHLLFHCSIVAPAKDIEDAQSGNAEVSDQRHRKPYGHYKYA